VFTAAAVLFGSGALGLGRHGGGGGLPAAAMSSATSPIPVGGNAELVRLQRHLADDPQDSAGWADLGSAYVQQARITVDPAFYPKAQGALERSLALLPQRNLPAFLGMGALANARHDFADALRWGHQARAVSPYNPGVYAVLTDAYTQLGKPGPATAAVQRMLDLSPALPALTRASYDLEQRGQVPAARELLAKALDNAYVPADVAFCRYYLGELAFHAGDLAGATEQYRRGLVADPQNTQLLQGRAKVAALRGDTATAVRDYADLVSRVPYPQYLIEYGELLTTLGRTAEAKAQFDLVEVEHQLFTSNGGQDDLTLAEFEADHGSPALAVKYAKAEWDRRQMAVVADTLGWALHKAGQDDKALHYANLALARGWDNALFLYHRSEIERSLGHSSAARADAARVHRADRIFDPKLAAFARPT
jgi:tetratricopeptide (TPR) repeat protein